MEIMYMQEEAGRYCLAFETSGNSNAIHIPADSGDMTAILSNVSGGTAKVQYSLSSQMRVESDSAVWHDWSIGDVDDVEGIKLDSPISYLRAVALDAVSYRLELLT